MQTMPRILWLRSSARSEEVDILEQHTGFEVMVSSSSNAWHDLDHRIRAVVVELPLAADTIREILVEIHHTAVPVAVILYDPGSILDEALIQPPMASFQHVTERLSAERLAQLVAQEVQRANELGEKAFLTKEPWKKLLIGESRAMKLVHSLVRLAGPRRSTVLLSGETGTGKEMVARAIHMASSRAGARMVSVNCAAIPENLVESELFGTVKGAFTGAINDRPGRFEMAHRGTIFLDEVGEIPIDIQPKLLRVLQERELQRVGGTTDVQIDTRVIAASNQDLDQAVSDKRFREDLLYRLNVVPIAVPPLRERASDIPLLADHFIEKVCTREGLRSKSLTADAVRRLSDYEWPGNVRQLEHAIEMAVTLSGNRARLYSGDFRLAESKPMAAATGALKLELPQKGGINLEKMVDRVEQLLIQEALQQCGGNKARAASSLGIPRTTLVYKLRNQGVCA